MYLVMKNPSQFAVGVKLEEILAEIPIRNEELRPGHIHMAVQSVRGMEDILPSLNASELLYLLELEVESQRRSTVTDRLVQRLGRLIEERTRATLTRRFSHG